MDKRDFKDMWVYIEHNGVEIEPVSLELCCEIRKIADSAREKLAAVIVGTLPQTALDRITQCGVDKLIQVMGAGYEPFNIDAYTALFAKLCIRHLPSAVFVGGTVNGRDFAPRFACRLRTGCTSDATELVFDKTTGNIEFIEPAVGGKMMAIITVPEMRPQVGTIRPGTFKYLPAGARKVEYISERIDFDPELIRTEVLNYEPYDEDDTMDLSTADVVVCIGNGVKTDSVPLYLTLAKRLGGTLGCTRPVFDRGILPYKQVIGQSGVMIKPRLLLSFGVSGALNHVTGISGSGKIFAVNDDPEADIFHYCDYGIIGDMDEICCGILAGLD